MKWIYPAAALTLIGAYVLASRALAVQNAAFLDSLQDDQPDQLPTTLESIAVDLTPSTYIAPAVPQVTADANMAAFLDMISYSEGTSGPDGYRVMFGGSLAPNLDDHPRKVFSFTNSKGERLTTTAAGRYQFLARTWDALVAQLGLPDFGPASQDAGCIELIRQRGALNDVKAGRFATAVAKCAPTWASLPGAGYNQPERKLSQLMAAYTASGGNLEA